jgi:phospholipid/cholesterol/gamma-HCH transport system permease protein
LGGFVSEFSSSKISFALYIRRAFENLELANFIAPTVKTAVFEFIIGTVSAYFGYSHRSGECRSRCRYQRHHGLPNIEVEGR